MVGPAPAIIKNLNLIEMEEATADGGMIEILLTITTTGTQSPQETPAIHGVRAVVAMEEATGVPAEADMMM